MNKVIIDGLEYTPITENSSIPKIGVAITTHNRNDIVKNTYDKWVAMSPPGIPIIIVDDGSNKPVVNATHRNNKPLGIAASKNISLHLLENMGVEHFFLVDDDVYPSQENWWKPYVDNSEPHLMFIFEDLKSGPKLNDIQKVYESETTIAWSGARGVVLYCDKSVLKTVGGLDEAYARWGYEHMDWSSRIYYAGLTSHLYQDVKNSEQLFHSMDQYCEIGRTVSTDERKVLVEKNFKLFTETHKTKSKKYCSYYPKFNEVCGILYTALPNPQNPSETYSDNAALNWVKSIQKFSPTTKITLITDYEPSESWEKKVQKYWTVYWDKHFKILQYLKENPRQGWVWVTDTTDVLMLNQPNDLSYEKIYVGSEPTVLQNEWMNKNHFSKDWSELNKANKTLLNVGVYGGEYFLLVEFMQDLVSYYEKYLSETHTAKGKILESYDMGGFNVISYSDKWINRIEYGSHITTVFKKEETVSKAIWKHK